MLVAAGGGALAFVMVVLLNRLLVGIGFSIKKHPKAGSLELTGAALFVGIVGSVAGYIAASGPDARSKIGEFVAAALGSIIVVYIVVTAGVIVGAFHRVHFNTDRLTITWLVIPVLALLVKAIQPIVDQD